MYAGSRVISAYIREKGIKSHVQKIIGVFRDDLGNNKGIIMVHGVQRVYRGTGEAIKCDQLCVVKSTVTPRNDF